MALDVRCPNCGTSFAIGENGTPVNPNTLDGVGYLAPTVIRNENNNNKGENTTMGKNVTFGIDFANMTNEDKAELLKKMGFNPFDVMSASPVNTSGELAEQMYANGYVKNQKLHRRFIPAHTLKLLGWTNGVTKETSCWSNREYTVDKWTDNLNKWHDYMYQFYMLKEEIRVISVLEKSDAEAFAERTQFFDKFVVLALCADYISKLKQQLKNSKITPVRYCKKVPYIRIKGKDIFVDDIEKKVIIPLQKISLNIRLANTYEEIYSLLCKFTKSDFFVKLNEKYASKCPAWVDAFKGAGAYYTMDNLVKYSGLKLVNYDTGNQMDIKGSLEYLANELLETKGERFRLLALLKKSLEVQNFVFADAIKK